MIKDFFHRIALRRHFWRHASFSEVAELYASRMLRMAAIFIISSFVSIYLYQIGYTLPMISFFWCGFFIFRVIISLPIARLVAYIGPKHAILVSNILYIPAMVAYALLPTFGPGMLFVAAFFQTISTTMYSIGYMIDFSKVKSTEHAGAQIAYMNIFEKVTTGLTPLIGGFVAFLWGPQVVIVLSAVLFALAAVPLFRTGEQVRVNQKLVFRGFPWRLLLRHSVAQSAVGFDVFTSGTVWNLFIAVIIIGVSAGNNSIYAITGLLLSVVLVVALLASYIYGRIIDRKKGGELMRIGAVGNALTHAMRPFVVAPVSIVGLNAANELVTTGYTLPYTRAVFDNADLSGMRTTYLGLVELLSNFGAAVGAFILGVGAVVFGSVWALHGFFFVAAAVALLVLTARFPLYKK
jgi:MFS family permease